MYSALTRISYAYSMKDDESVVERRIFDISANTKCVESALSFSLTMKYCLLQYFFLLPCVFSAKSLAESLQSLS